MISDRLERQCYRKRQLALDADEMKTWQEEPLLCGGIPCANEFHFGKV